ncbi:MAG TPA: hypothetical protein VGJ33_17195 [Candidatus Angelobacter sp.]|jgi:hypothetical protein
MDIKWWEVIVGLGVAGALVWSKTRRPAELGLNRAPEVKITAHATEFGKVRFGGSSLTTGASPLETAHKHSFKNRDEIDKSTHCGCFYCEKNFPPAEIWEWVDDEQTAMCPFCGIDSVLGNFHGFELSKEFLHSMNERWFAS